MKGFTLVETLVAVSILALTVAGPLYAASRAIVAAQIARDQLTASYLAQEGIEYVRMMRDNEYLSAYLAGTPNVSTAAWNDFLTGSSPASITQCRASACTLDVARSLGSSLSACGRYGCPPLYLANGIYTQQSTIPGAVKTSFVRTVQALDVSLTDQLIVSMVTWNFHGTPYVVKVTDHLTPWQ